MTKRAFIWDLDGTLLDSYDAILAGLEETYATYQLLFDRASIKDYHLEAFGSRSFSSRGGGVSSGCDGLESSPSRKSSGEKCPGPSDGWGA